MYGMNFLRRSPKLLAVEGYDTPDMQFIPGGYLTLASDEGYEQLRANYEVQRQVDVRSVCLILLRAFRPETYLYMILLKCLFILFLFQVFFVILCVV